MEAYSTTSSSLSVSLTILSPKKPAEEATPGWGRGEILDQIGRGIPILTEHI